MVTALALVAVLAVCGAETPESSPDSASSDAHSPGDPVPAADLITPDGWGPLRIGMSQAEVVAAAGEDANPDAVGGPEPDRCDEFRPSDAPAGVLVMIESGFLTRISVSRNSDVTSPEGFRVGGRGSDVIERHGSHARVDAHMYWEPPAKNITIWREPAPESDRRGIRYEVDANDRIVHIRAGGPSIENIEGCI